MRNFDKIQILELTRKLSLEFYDCETECEKCILRNYCSVDKTVNRLNLLTGLFDEEFLAKVKEVEQGCEKMWCIYLESDEDNWESALQINQKSKECGEH